MTPNLRPSLQLREAHAEDAHAPCKLCGKEQAPLRARLMQLQRKLRGPRDQRRPVRTKHGPAWAIASSPEIAVCIDCASEKGEAPIKAAVQARAEQITGVIHERK